MLRRFVEGKLQSWRQAEASVKHRLDILGGKQEASFSWLEGGDVQDMAAVVLTEAKRLVGFAASVLAQAAVLGASLEHTEAQHEGTSAVVALSFGDLGDWGGESDEGFELDSVPENPKMDSGHEAVKLCVASELARLCRVPGIGGCLAKALLGSFGSCEAVLAAAKHDSAKILAQPGIGEKRLQQLQEAAKAQLSGCAHGGPSSA
ncbi:unnamed protein product [Symbiodinium necroappetens]|uniref:Uncharacterized protein n=1 Tax=Symbiodinium necroappetens TaxID=1628268 RepID=A0A813CKZ1_9DINO|nr:unnamed protein product [Symbiodinium necroappetens]